MKLPYKHVKQGVMIWGSIDLVWQILLLVFMNVKQFEEHVGCTVWGNEHALPNYQGLHNLHSTTILLMLGDSGLDIQ